MKHVLRFTAVALAFSVCAPAMAAIIVVPNAGAATAGNGGLNTIMRNSGNPRSYQVMYAASELTGITPGMVITGFNARMFGTQATFPPAGGANWTDYEIRVSTAATTVATMSTTFANNTGGDEVLVHDGPLSIPDFNYPGGGPAPNPWGLTFIQFQTPFTYNGGDLLLDIRHPGGTHTNASGFLDGFTTTHASNGVTQRGLSQSVWPTPTTGAFTTGYILQLEYIPEPATMGLLALGGLTLIRRRR